jgi:hypothetical protein
VCPEIYYRVAECTELQQLARVFLLVLPSELLMWMMIILTLDVETEIDFEILIVYKTTVKLRK